MASREQRQRNTEAVKRHRSRESYDQKQERLRKAKEYKRRKRAETHFAEATLEPISDAVQQQTLQRLRLSLGPERLDAVFTVIVSTTVGICRKMVRFFHFRVLCFGMIQSAMVVIHVVHYGLYEVASSFFPFSVSV
jgi:hypothetical protein